MHHAVYALRCTCSGSQMRHKLMDHAENWEAELNKDIFISLLREEADFILYISLHPERSPIAWHHGWYKEASHWKFLKKYFTKEVCLMFYKQWRKCYWKNCNKLQRYGWRLWLQSCSGSNEQSPLYQPLLSMFISQMEAAAVTFTNDLLLLDFTPMGQLRFTEQW